METFLAYLVQFLFALVAGILSILAVLAIERQKKPQLTFDVAQQGEIFDDDKLKRPAAKWLKIKVKNDNLSGPLSWIYDRDPALLCRASVTFNHLDGHSVFGRTLSARWDNTPEPQPLIGHTDQGDVAIMPYVHETYDIPPGEYTTIALVYRAKGEAECYGWNNESYLYGFKHPEWKLEKGRYIAEVSIRTRGRTFVSRFMIFNDVEYHDVRLEMLAKDDVLG